MGDFYVVEYLIDFNIMIGVLLDVMYGLYNMWIVDGFKVGRLMFSNIFRWD